MATLNIADKPTLDELYSNALCEGHCVGTEILMNNQLQLPYKMLLLKLKKLQKDLKKQIMKIQ